MVFHGCCVHRINFIPVACFWFLSSTWKLCRSITALVSSCSLRINLLSLWKKKREEGRRRKKISQGNRAPFSPPGSFISEQAKPSFHLNRDVMNDAHFCNSLGANYSFFLLLWNFFFRAWNWVRSGFSTIAWVCDFVTVRSVLGLEHFK